MGLLISKIVSSIFGSKERKIVIVGLNNAGKTTILYAMHLGRYVTTAPTLGGNVEEVNVGGVKMVMWDLGGQEALRSAWSLYYEGAHGVVLVVDSTDKARFHLVKKELGSILAHHHLAQAAILIFANKQDLPSATPPEVLAEELGLTAIRSHAYHIQGCSALMQKGLTEGFDWLAKASSGK